METTLKMRNPTVVFPAAGLLDPKYLQGTTQNQNALGKSRVKGSMVNLKTESDLKQRSYSRDFMLRPNL